MLLHPEVVAEEEDGATAVDLLAPSATSAERSGTSPVRALRLPLEDHTVRSAVVVVDPKRLATLAVV